MARTTRPCRLRVQGLEPNLVGVCECGRFEVVGQPDTAAIDTAYLTHLIDPPTTGPATAGAAS